MERKRGGYEQKNQKTRKQRFIVFHIMPHLEKWRRELKLTSGQKIDRMTYKMQIIIDPWLYYISIPN